MSWQSLQELASDVQRGASSVALVRAALSRIAAVDAEGGINAVVVLDAERALARAAALDRLPPAERRRLPLAGVPVTVKEHIHVAGLPATAGDPARAGLPAPASAPVVLALEAAGAIVIGKTNVPLDVADYQSYNTVYGRTNNPHDLSLSPGGSSGGSAAAVAAGLVPLCIGTDIGGSVRVPAHCCGVFAHKPTWGVISKSDGDHAPPKPLSTTGPIARHAADLTLVTRLLFAGARERFGGLARAVVPEGAATHTSLAGCRVALWADDPVCPVDAAVASALRATVALLEREGAVVTPARPDVDSAALLRCFQECVGDAVDGPAGIRPAAARLATARAQCRIRAAVDDLLRDHDVLLTPTFPVVAFPHDDGDGADRPFYRPSARTLGDARLPYHLGCFWPAVANLTLLPATAFPVQGEEEGGLPVALQLVGRELDDFACLRIAELLEVAGAGTRVAQFRIPRRLRTRQGASPASAT